MFGYSTDLPFTVRIKVVSERVRSESEGEVHTIVLALIDLRIHYRSYNVTVIVTCLSVDTWLCYWK